MRRRRRMKIHNHHIINLLGKKKKENKKQENKEDDDSFLEDEQEKNDREEKVKDKEKERKKMRMERKNKDEDGKIGKEIQSVFMQSESRRKKDIVSHFVRTPSLDTLSLSSSLSLFSHFLLAEKFFSFEEDNICCCSHTNPIK